MEENFETICWPFLSPPEAILTNSRNKITTPPYHLYLQLSQTKTNAANDISKPSTTPSNNKRFEHSPRAVQELLASYINVLKSFSQIE